ncbi:hypothetical protein K432DRAFT_455259 [Lepidopterella palustris CBS 459.81]|uniref:Uncharacterized protein n=1 Tax=Lepidopterella palustris CBS 459.81 TaxID=1314670 RepID=A0A8E2JL24_9PEZI|nr:hypothetical protein K432DRAFT_455259 [Lepidopterella palustris CBS 459.81]
MFWGCFSGKEKGPCLFWDKDWASINKQSCCEKIVPYHLWLALTKARPSAYAGWSTRPLNSIYAAGANRARYRDYLLACLLTRPQSN